MPLLPSPRAALPLVLALCGLAGRGVRGSYTPPTKFLIVSNALNGSVGYIQLSRDGNFSEAKTLIDKDLVRPQGIAVDQKRQLLLIADSELKKVVSYGLIVHEDGTLGVDEQTPVAEDVPARWVAVDGLGDVYFTDEEDSKVLKVSAGQLLDGDTKPRPVFADPSGNGAGSIRSPGGVATDNFHVYWTNKENAQNVGTVVKALQGPARSNATGAEMDAKVLATNLDKAYGLCFAMGTLYYTGTEKNVFAVAAKGSNVVTVSSELSNPRGCVWDGESTIYVADRSADGIFALPTRSLALVQAPAKKVAAFEGAFGVAVFSSARRLGLAVGALLAPLLLASLTATL